jgi:AraC-like DNA-binding protein
MDVLCDLLDGPRASGAFVLRAVLEPPWSLRIEDEAPLALVAMIAGGASIVHDGSEPVRLGAGALAIVRGPHPYTVADRPETPPQVVIHPGQRCTTVGGRDLHSEMDLGIRTWGNDPQGSTELLTGVYQLEGEISRRLLAALPPVLVVPRADRDDRLVTLLADEVARELPGQEAVLDRLLDLLLVATLRRWFNRPGAEAPAWYRAHSDPAIGPALRLLQQHPARPWTVASLAREVGVSRATFARRFGELMGEPPMRYLTQWRLAVAADLLREPDATVASVARQVGYATPFALSTAFTRERGVSPSQHRAAGTSHEASRAG